MSLAFPADPKGEHSGSIFFLFLAVPGLSCGTWDLWLQQVGSNHLLTKFFDQGSNLSPLHWKHGVLATGPPEKSLEAYLVTSEHTFPTLTLCACAKSSHLCLPLCKPIDCSPPGSSVHGILQSRILEWVAVSSSRDLYTLSSLCFFSAKLLDL